MKINKLYMFLLSALSLSLTVVSCDDEASAEKSTIMWFESYPVTMTSPALTVSEDDADTYTLDFALDDRQITPVHLEIHVGEASTATEGEDFELITHDVELLALEGREGFSIELEVLDDMVADEGDETIYLTFTSTLPSGVQTSETLAITIQDSDL